MSRISRTLHVSDFMEFEMDFVNSLKHGLILAPIVVVVLSKPQNNWKFS